MRAGKLLICGVTPLFLGCVLARDVVTLPATDPVVRDQLFVHSDSPLVQHDRLVDELATHRGDIAEQLQLPVSREPVHVYLFDTAGKLGQFVAHWHPEFPNRRAYFVQSDGQLRIYAHRNERLDEDLRHEMTHAYLHPILPRLPLWLDEGLAEYFEVPRGQHGYNPPHVDMLRRGLQAADWSPDLPRLEQLAGSDEMTQQDYAEAWAWVHFLLETGPARREILLGHLRVLHSADHVPPLSQVLVGTEPQASQQLIQHLELLRSAAASTAWESPISHGK